MKYRKKPVVVDVNGPWLLVGDDPDVFMHQGTPTDKCEKCGFLFLDHGEIKTLESGKGKHVVCPGDMIITGVQGERYPCKPDIFAATYEAVIEPASERTT